MDLKTCMLVDMKRDYWLDISDSIDDSESMEEREIRIAQQNQDDFYDRVYRPLKLDTEAPQEFKVFYDVEEYRAKGYIPISSIVDLPESVKEHMLIPDAFYICKSQPYYMHRKKIEDGDEDYYSYKYNELEEEIIKTELYHKNQLKLLHKAFSDHFEYIYSLDEDHITPFVEIKYFALKPSMNVKVPIFKDGSKILMLRTYFYRMIL